MSYELTLDLHGARLEIEAESVDELEEKVRALDVTRLESLIAEKRVSVSASAAPAAPATAARGGKKASKKASRKSTKKGARKAGKAKGEKTPTGAE